MMIVMKEGATEEQIASVVKRVESVGAHAHVSEGDVLSHSSGKDISHVILCEAPTKKSTTTTTTTTTTKTSTTSSSTSPSTGPVVETDLVGGSSGLGLAAGLAVILGGLALTIAGLRRPSRKH